MKTTTLTRRIATALAKARVSQNEAGAYAFLPEIIESLEAMESNVSAPRAQRIRMAGALGRLVTEDYAFSESTLGTELLNVADEFAS